MGNSSSTSKETQRANERKYVRSLGDRYPLGDAELRKWCWCHEKLASGSSSLGLPAGVKATTFGPLSAVAVWSTLYGDFNPYVRRPATSPAENSNKGVIIGRTNASNKALDAINNVEQHLFPAGLGPSIIQKALGLPSLKRTEYNMLSGENGIDLDEEHFYSIASSVNQYLTSREDAYSSSQSQQSLEDFLEGVSTSCGRRGSRASLSKLFAVSITSHNNANQPERLRKAEASTVINTAYCLALAASFLRNVAATVNRDAIPINVQDFIPQTDPKEMQSMVNSLIESAQKQRRDGGVGGGMGGGNFTFDYSYGANNTNTSDSSDTNETTMISLDEFLEWAETTVPMIASALPTFLQVLFTFFTPATGITGDNENNNEPRFPPGVTPLWMPSLTVDQSRHSTHSSPTSSFFHAPPSSSFDLFALSCTSLTLASGRWHRLFSSEANGLSCNRLMHSIIGYGGPTIIIIRSKDLSDKGKCSSGMFGAYTHSPWSQESSSFYGNSDCFLFRLGSDPLAVYRPKGGDTDGLDAFGAGNTSNKNESETRNYMYYNPEARSKGYDGLAHGVGFGGTSELPRLYIDEFLDGCRAAPEDLTYEKGPLLSGLKDSNSSATSHFEVEAMEAWGVGTSELVEEALLARVGQRADKQKQIKKAMKGKGQFLEDLQLTGAKVFQHRDQIRGRDGGCDLDKSEGEEE